MSSTSVVGQMSRNTNEIDDSTKEHGTITFAKCDDQINTFEIQQQKTHHMVTFTPTPEGLTPETTVTDTAPPSRQDHVIFMDVQDQGQSIQSY